MGRFEVSYLLIWRFPGLPGQCCYAGASAVEDFGCCETDSAGAAADGEHFALEVVVAGHGCRSAASGLCVRMYCLPVYVCVCFCSELQRWVMGEVSQSVIQSVSSTAELLVGRVRFT
jgi:hypothetical protein